MCLIPLFLTYPSRFLTIRYLNLTFRNDCLHARLSWAKYNNRRPVPLTDQLLYYQYLIINSVQCITVKYLATGNILFRRQRFPPMLHTLGVTFVHTNCLGS